MFDDDDIKAIVQSRGDDAENSGSINNACKSEKCWKAGNKSNIK